MKLLIIGILGRPSNSETGKLLPDMPWPYLSDFLISLPKISTERFSVVLKLC